MISTPREDGDADDSLFRELLQESESGSASPDPEHVEQLRRQIEARTRLSAEESGAKLVDDSSRDPAAAPPRYSSPMKANNRDDDLFKDSTMTFGEHLSELRTCLFKAVLSITVGFIFGLCIGKWIVKVIQDPLETAMINHEINRVVKGIIKDRKAELQLQGRSLPEELKDEEAEKEYAKQLRTQLFEQQLVSSEAYLAPNEVLEALQQMYPDPFGKIKLPEAAAGGQKIDRTKMLHLHIWRPAEDDPRLKLEGLNVQEPFMMYVKASLIAGIIMASPLVFYYLWSFVAAGLYPNEKRYVNVFLPFSVVLFLAGAIMAYFFVFPPVLDFFFGFSDWLGQEQRPRISEWLSFVLMLPLAFGVSFQLPLVMLFLERIGLVTVKQYLTKWKFAILGMSIAAMVLSPGGDIYSMMLMLIPMIFLYFGGILLCTWMPAVNRPAAG